MRCPKFKWVLRVTKHEQKSCLLSVIPLSFMYVDPGIHNFLDLRICKWDSFTFINISVSNSSTDVMVTERDRILPHTCSGQYWARTVPVRDGCTNVKSCRPLRRVDVERDVCFKRYLCTPEPQQINDKLTLVCYGPKTSGKTFRVEAAL